MVRSDKKPTLIAGYPWFTDWSRDILISLPALIVAGFDPAETKSILDFLLAERKQGILPNRFSDSSSKPEYNTVDASLWFFIAAQVYVEATNDIAFLENTLFPAALDIIDWHTRGTFYNIHVDPADHLLSAGEAGTQLTWMDAKIGDYVVTPRIGKPVEINALWFNALKISSHWATLLGQTAEAEDFSARASLVQIPFYTASGTVNGIVFTMSSRLRDQTAAYARINCSPCLFPIHCWIARRLSPSFSSFNRHLSHLPDSEPWNHQTRIIVRALRETCVHEIPLIIKAPFGLGC